MPFTVSHAAAVLPFHFFRSRLPLTALMIGSMSPDFAYFLPPAAQEFETHGALGILLFCMPVGIVLWWVFVWFLERPSLALVPEPWRAGLPPPTHRISTSLAVRAAIAVVLGAVTHVVWDWFTHAFTPVTEALPFLRTTRVSIGDAHMPLYFFLQILSSALGLAALAIWALRLRHNPRPDAAPRALPAVSTATRVVAVAAIVLGAGTFALAYYFWSDELRIADRLFYLLIGGMTGCALAWCAVAAWLNARWRAA